MRKKLSVSIVCLVALLSLLLMPTLIADAHRSRHHRHDDDDDEIRCDIQIILRAPDERPPTWDGTIKGDIKGTFDINLIGAAFLDSDLQPVDSGDPDAVWEIYWEWWYIKTRKGTITVLQSGVWSFVTFDFRSNGPVVDATGKWANLIGSTMYVSGVTNDPFTEWPVIGDGEMWIRFDYDNYDDDDD